MIVVSVKFSCTAKLDPLKARIYCAIRNERVSCDLLGIKARSTLSPYISCDDIDLEKRLGSGTYLDFIFSSEMLKIDILLSPFSRAAGRPANGSFSDYPPNGIVLIKK